MADVKYEYAGMQSCLDDVNSAISEVHSVTEDLTAIINGIELSIKTQEVSAAMTAVYRTALQGITDEVLTPMEAQKRYVEECMLDAQSGDKTLAGNWG